LTSSGGRSRLLEAACALAVVGFDQLTKALVRDNLRLYHAYEIIPGLVSLVHGRNRGMAFGVFSAGGLPRQAIVLAVISGAVLLLVVAQWHRLAEGPATARIALALIAGGAVGNLIDRIRLGYVTDFVHVYWGSHVWPDFNVADSAISIGICLLLVDALRPRRTPAP
jgi:signal peptidase II